MAKLDIQNFARLGAEARLRQLDEERAAILSAFPGLAGGARGRGAARRGGRGRGARAAAGRDTAEAAAPATRRRRRSRMTAEQRRAVSERMKKYWAGRRAAGKKAK